MSDIVEDTQRRVAYWRYIATNAAEIGIAVPTLDMPGVADIVEGLLSEIARLRLAIRRLADQDATLSVCDGNVTVTIDAALTDAEREALEAGVALLLREAANETRAAWFSADHKDRYAAEADRMGAFAAALRGLLERHAKGGGA